MLKREPGMEGMIELKSETELLSLMLAELQGIVPYAARERVADVMAGATGSLTGRLEGAPPARAAADKDVRNLRTLGLAELGPKLSPTQVERIRQHFLKRPCFDNHVRSQSDGELRPFSERLAKSRHACYPLADVVDAPYLIELANSDEILALAEAYLGCAPTLYSLNAFWSFPEMDRPTRGLQTFHRDFDDFRFCTLFVYLTDVTPDDGAHIYLTETHRHDTQTALLQRLVAADPAYAALIREIDENELFSSASRDLDAICDRLLRPAFRTVHGASGSAFVEDTYGLHRGSIPLTPRLVFWARYGLYQNLTVFKDRIGSVGSSMLSGRVPATAYHRYVNRLLAPEWRG